MTSIHSNAVVEQTQNLSDTEAMPAFSGLASMDWSQYQTRKMFRVTLGRATITLESSSDRLPEWLEIVIAELNRLAGLAPNWDSYGARPVAQRTIEHTLEAVIRLVEQGAAAPSLRATPQGGIELAWHSRGRDLEVTIERPFVISIFYHNEAHPETDWEGRAGLDLQEILDRVAVLKA